jgi:putative transposase
LVSGFVADLFRSRNNLLAENALLRQQLIVASRKVKQPQFRPLERGLVVALSAMVKNWQSAIVLVKPDTVLRWHREGLRLLWGRKSRTTKQRQPRINAETIALIRDMAATNRTWGAQRIRGELLKLGIRVAERTIQRHILAVRPPGDG